MSAREIATQDLTIDEQEHVRAVLQFMRTKLDGWEPLAKLLKFDTTTVLNAGNGRRTVTASMAFRLARIIGVPIDDLITGKWPEPGTCPRCGYVDKRSSSGQSDPSLSKDHL